MIKKFGGGLLPQNGPWICSGCDAYFLLAAADGQTLQKQLDEQINLVMGRQRYVVVADAVAITFQTIHDLQSRQASNPQPLRLAYREAALWLLIRDVDDGSIRVWVPYIFCTDPVALYTGREIYGFPKEFANIEVPNAAGNFTVETHTANHTNPPDMPQSKILISAKPVLGLYEINAGISPKMTGDILAKIRQERMQESTTGWWQSWGGFDSPWSKYVSLLISPSINFVFSRHQFNLNNQDWNSSIALANSPVTQYSFKSLLQPYKFSLGIETSHDMANALGLIGVKANDKFELTSTFGASLSLKFELSVPHSG